MEPTIFGMHPFLFSAIVWIIPFFLVLFSNKTFGKEKVTWIIAVLAVSWFSWFFYSIIAPVVERPEEEENNEQTTSTSD